MKQSFDLNSIWLLIFIPTLIAYIYWVWINSFSMGRFRFVFEFEELVFLISGVEKFRIKYKKITQVQVISPSEVAGHGFDEFSIGMIQRFNRKIVLIATLEKSYFCAPSNAKKFIAKLSSLANQ